MRRVFRFSFLVVLVVLAATAAHAQFGHPLKGTWSGEWGPSKTQVGLEFNWDGKNLTGAINPGANAVPFGKVTLDGATWTVHAEGDKDGMKYVVDGKMENIGMHGPRR